MTRDPPLLDLHSHFLINATLLGKRFDRRHGRAWFVNPLRNHYDLPRAREGNVGGTTFAIYVPWWPRALGGPMEAVRASRRALDRILARCGDAAVFCRTAADVRRALAAGRFAALASLEGLRPIGRDLDRIAELHRMGIRMATLVHFVSTAVGDAVWGPVRHHGLGQFGRDAVRELQRLGILVDLAHASAETFRDVVATTRAPLVVSHTAARSAGSGSRGISDRQLDAVRDCDGLVGVILFPAYLREGAVRVPVDRVAEHAARIADRIGVRHVGIGSDIDANIWLPEGFRDVSSFPRVVEALRRHGFAGADLEAVLQGNYLRVLEATDPAFTGEGPDRPDRPPPPNIGA